MDISSLDFDLKFTKSLEDSNEEEPSTLSTTPVTGSQNLLRIFHNVGIKNSKFSPVYVS